MPKFRKKPIIVEAMRFNGDNESAMAIGAWMVENGRGRDLSFADHGLLVQTPHGIVLAEPGHWVVRDVKGEFYPCKPDVFEATYEPVGPPAPE